ncbi:addiction module antidote protein [Vibrio antiquarius]|uniref:Addiction module antidote protein n=1 Tax=Vibrio parahaemolyticus TaxID=670 RepID=A0AA46Z8W0_VIBPH|nr:MULTISPECIES: addiction module antidote protein [Vibrio harveyi group]KOE80261.1 hypothetical protein ACS91_22955 [Vibrio parahaemolyticus]MCS0314563.1 putative addiction module antidote protein [Vibrio diabolicus]UYV29754.1 putative addiction module antidote protein [Vibrio parahaemolyticus]UYW19204.1 putative addiction module antidote protein [Vibrio parahaemolyticus]
MKETIDKINQAIERCEHQELAYQVGKIAREKGMSHLADKTGLSRETLYRTLSRKGNPCLKTLLVVMNELGLKLSCDQSS